MPKLKEDREVVMAAVTNFGYALEFAPTFQADKEVVLAVKSQGDA